MPFMFALGRLGSGLVSGGPKRGFFKPLFSVALLSVLAVAGSLGVTTPAAAAQDASKATQRLFEAVRANDLAAVQASLNAGASIDATDRWGMTAPDLAVDKGYFRIAHFLASVRHFRASSDSLERAKAATPPAAPAPKQTAAADTGKAQAAARKSESPSQAKAGKPAPAAADTAGGTAPSWPADRPNPFDPRQVAFGSTIPIVATGAAGSQLASVVDQTSGVTETSRQGQ